MGGARRTARGIALALTLAALDGLGACTGQPGGNAANEAGLPEASGVASGGGPRDAARDDSTGQGGGDATIDGGATVDGDATIYGDGPIFGDATIYVVSADATSDGDATATGCEAGESTPLWDPPSPGAIQVTVQGSDAIVATEFDGVLHMARVHLTP